MTNFFSKIEILIPQKWRYLLTHQGFKRYFANTGWMFFGQIFSLLISFFVGVWLARYLGPENFGVLSYALAFAGLFAFFADFGIGGILNRELVKFPEKRDELLGTGFFIKLFGGFTAFSIVAFITLIIKATLITKILIVLFAFSFILQAINVINIFFYSKVDSKKNVRVVIVATTISSFLKIFTIVMGQGVLWIMFIYVLDSVWQAIGFMLTYRRYGLKIGDWKFNKSLAREIIRDSLPLMFASVAGFIYLRIDQVMVGKLMGIREVGFYAVAVRLVEVWYFLPAIICGSLFPAIINAKKTNEVIYHKRLKALYLLMVGISIAIAIPTTILAPWITSTFFGQEYMQSTIILQIYVWSSIGLFLGTAITQYFLSENKTMATFYFNFLSMLANVILNLILIPRIGLIGAAVATLISYSVAPIFVFINWFSRRRKIEFKVS